MWHAIITIILIGTIHANAQSGSGKSHPFQVLYAENVKNRLGVAIKSLDLIDIDDTLHIHNGTLSLIHYSGFPVEINSDTLIEIQKLHELIGDNSGSIKNRPYLNFLFFSDKKDAYKNSLSRFGICHDCGPSIVSYPPVGIIYYKNDLCVKWRYEFRNSYHVTMRNIYDEVLKEFPPNTTEIFLDSAELNRLKINEETFLITFQLSSKREVLEPILIKKYNKHYLAMPFPCTPTQATSALMAAFYNEQPGVENLIDAERYYLLAAQLSDRKFYSDMLANFRKRNGK